MLKVNLKFDFRKHVAVHNTEKFIEDEKCKKISNFLKPPKFILRKKP
jgi:hypothetical protein